MPEATGWEEEKDIMPLLHSYNIGICYNFQVNEKLPVEPFDRRMDEVWTENGILK